MQILKVDTETARNLQPDWHDGAAAGTLARDSRIRGGEQRRYRPWVMAEGSLEALKWLGIVFMTADHINKFLYAETLPVVFQVGRIVMPMFGFVLGYNLARPEALATGMHGRMLYRLTLAGIAATPVCIMLNAFFVHAHAWWPLNILFTLLLVVLLTYLIDRGGVTRYLLATALFLIGGVFVEYFWMGVLCCLGAWGFCRHASPARLGLWCLATLSLTFVNGNTYALLAIPLVLLLGRRSFQLPRATRWFYVFYPVHLALLLGIRWAWF